MFACSLLSHLIALVVIIVPGEPVPDAADREMFRIFEEDGADALRPAQSLRMQFWGWYTGHRAHMQKMKAGTLLADDFSDPLIREMPGFSGAPDGAPASAQERIWGIWNPDETLAIGIEDGMLVVSGTSSHSATDPNYNGLVSKSFRDTDVVAVADVKTVSPAADLPGTHVGLVHLCGTTPDLFHELGFGRAQNGFVGWSHQQVSGLGSGMQFIGGLPALGDEHERFTSVRLEHDAATELSQAWVLRSGAWVEVGEARKVVMPTVKVELKVNVPAPGVEMETWFDNCRLYGRPQTHPARFLVYNSLVAPTDIEGVLVEVFLDDGSTPTTSGLTDGSGWADLTLPADRVYPAAARVRFTLTTGEAWDRQIDQDGLDGLYPGDVWAVRLNTLDMAGDDSWWKAVREQSLRAAAEADAK